MEIDLRWIDEVPLLPPTCSWQAWNDERLGAHAEVKFQSFQNEPDALLFPNLASLDGCLQLMKAIRSKPGFLPEAAWLAAGPRGCLGCIQGIRDANGLGAIQNLGVVPHARGLGLGTALLVQALWGFRRCGLKRSWLEVSARNRGAIRLYHQVGFQVRKTVYREMPVVPVEEITT